MQVSQSDIDRFFRGLVDSEASSRHFYNHLSKNVQRQPEDPFSALYREIMSAMDWSPAKSEAARRKQRHMKYVASLGVAITVASLELVGDLYVSNMTVPQIRSGVARNTRRTLSHVHALAWNSARTSHTNLAAMERGRDPKKHLAFLLGIRKIVRHHDLGIDDGSGIRLHPRSMQVIADENGQLTIRPRYTYRQDDEPHRCPAAVSKVERNGRNVGSLSTYLAVIGDVAMDQIYPAQFTIVDNWPMVGDEGLEPPTPSV